MILVLQKLKVFLGMALCFIGVGGTVVPVIPGVPIILAGIALMGTNHPLVLKTKQKLQHWRGNR
jgi:uncharacterized protein YqgC (DUF456 family)